MKPIAMISLGWLLLISANLQAADDVLPPEVKSLIGMKLPPVRVEGKDIKRDPRLEPLPSDYVLLQPASIPQWKYKGGWLLPQTNMGIEELYLGDLSIFVVDTINKNNKIKTILDAHVLPQNLLFYYIKDGKVVKKNKTGLYELNAMCEREASEVIVGLMRPEVGNENCQHKTTQVIRAWKIDPNTGSIMLIPSHGVTCLVPAADWC
jgi:hypothetical protein